MDFKELKFAVFFLFGWELNSGLSSLIKRPVAFGSFSSNYPEHPIRAATSSTLPLNRNRKTSTRPKNLTRHFDHKAVVVVANPDHHHHTENKQKTRAHICFPTKGRGFSVQIPRCKSGRDSAADVDDDGERKKEETIAWQDTNEAIVC